jgi:hypothetical protein
VRQGTAFHRAGAGEYAAKRSLPLTPPLKLAQVRPRCRTYAAGRTHNPSIPRPMDHTTVDDLRATARLGVPVVSRAESATCLDRRWEPGDLGSSGAERGGLARESAAVVPCGMFWLTNGSAACPAHPVRTWLKRGLPCQKLHCLPRQITPDRRGGRREWRSDEASIAPHERSHKGQPQANSRPPRRGYRPPNS